MPIHKTGLHLRWNFLNNSLVLQHNIKAQAEAQNVQSNTNGSLSIYARHVEDLVKKGWPEYDAKLRNREYVKTFIQGLPFKLKRLATEKKSDQNPTLEKPVIAFEILKNWINRKNIANEKTPKPSN